MRRSARNRRRGGRRRSRRIAFAARQSRRQAIARAAHLGPLGSEAEHWRAIRDSRNPADFMDYLARYGPDGAFSEVAELVSSSLPDHDTRAPAPRRPVRPPRHRRARRRRAAPNRRRAIPTQCRRPSGAPRRRATRRPPAERDSHAICVIRRKVKATPLRAFSDRIASAAQPSRAASISAAAWQSARRRRASRRNHAAERTAGLGIRRSGRSAERAF